MVKGRRGSDTHAPVQGATHLLRRRRQPCAGHVQRQTRQVGFMGRDERDLTNVRQLMNTAQEHDGGREVGKTVRSRQREGASQENTLRTSTRTCPRCKPGQASTVLVVLGDNAHSPAAVAQVTRRGDRQVRSEGTPSKLPATTYPWGWRRCRRGAGGSDPRSCTRKSCSSVQRRPCSTQRGRGSSSVVPPSQSTWECHRCLTAACWGARTCLSAASQP